MNLIITNLTHERKIQELKDLGRLIKDTKKDMVEAREQGDLSENFGYVAAKTNLANLNRVYDERNLEISTCEIVDPMDWKDLDMEGMPRAMIGSLVTIKRQGQEETVLLGGADDEIPGVVPYNSPLGKALIPKLEGESVELKLNEETETIEILKCETASAEKLRELYKAPPKKQKEVKKKEMAGPEPA